jgi:LacI family transcriptional regulator
MFAYARLEGFRQALIQLGMNLAPSYTLEGDLTQRDGHQKALTLLDLEFPPTAIVACNDLMALGAVSAAQKRGLKVGKDIAIIGYDDVPQAEHNHPSLTTIHQPIYRIGSMLCEMLGKIMRGEELEEKSIILKPSLIIRESCGG